MNISEFKRSSPLYFNADAPVEVLAEPSREAPSLGLLEPLFLAEQVTEIMVVGCRVFYETSGRIAESLKRFPSTEALYDLLLRLAAFANQELTLAHPYAHCPIAGARFTMTIPPFSVVPTLTIRKHPLFCPKPEDYLKSGFATQAALTLISEAVEDGLHLLVIGGSGAGKTTFARFLVRFVPQHERLITIEDQQELYLERLHPHVLSLITRPPNKEGKYAITASDAIRQALHLRADRIILGEVLGAEALQWIAATRTGHRGTFTTLHADDATIALRRLALFAHRGAPSASLDALEETFWASVHLVVHLERHPSGLRLLKKIVEIGDGRRLKTLWTHPQAS